MLNVLSEVLADIHVLLGDWNDWHTVDIDTAPPRIEQASRQFKDDYKLCIHRIHPCTTTNALYQPHPWPCAGVVCYGQCEMIVGYGDPKGPPPPISHRFILKRGSRYEMTDPNAWHAIAPIKTPVLSLVVRGLSYDPAHKWEHNQLRTLTKEEFLSLQEWFWYNSVREL